MSQLLLKSINTVCLTLVLLSLVACESEKPTESKAEIRPVRAQQIQLKKLSKPTI